MKEQLQELKSDALAKINGAKNIREIEDARVTYLGKKGSLTAVLKQMGKLSAEERPVMGAVANDVRSAIETAVRERETALKSSELAAALESEKVDITLPGRSSAAGRRHPLMTVMDEMSDIFRQMGYSVVFGPEIERTKYVFDMLNTHEGHPARDPGDTFYIDDETVLRTQTSSVQIRTMLTEKPPLAIISPGRVYRVDEADRTHSPVFHQCEGLVVDKGITFADLKGTLAEFFRRLYGSDVKLRFRPHHFPYTEPSAEVDLSCFKCGGAGCSFCKGEGWIEMLGSGFVHPQVLENCGIDSREYTGFAFGIGIERLTLMRYEIDDIRLLYENNVKFLRQF
ncbi:phenylalanine--tRNA ligase alpha subunit [Clostridia bacterium]|nr:phenylalanine--tRNA ligase alpha subunit [Clostridia bacterium]